MPLHCNINLPDDNLAITDPESITIRDGVLTVSEPAKLEKIDKYRSNETIEVTRVDVDRIQSLHIYQSEE